MALNQIAFDFDYLPPAPKQTVNNTISTKPEIKSADGINIIDLSDIKKINSKKTDNKKQTRGRMSLKELDTGVDLIEIPEDAILFEKSYYSMSKVAEMFKVNQSLIRFWENEFNLLKPKKNGKGDRLFRPEDIKNLKLIYHLLRERKYTLEGAKDFLKNHKKLEKNFEVIESLKNIKTFLNELKANL